jgi:prepilin-type N-terminal cleavage/methylation domain-containing protein
MNTQQTSSIKRGFTLMELMVAMAITTIIVTVLVSITSIALDTWNRSRSELRASRQAKGMIDTMARDFESLVTRRGNANEWLSAITESGTIGDKVESTNASKLIFFSAPTDRYNGEIAGKDQIMGNADDPAGGDVSCVAYQLDYKDPIDSSASGFETFVLSRKLVDPKPTFDQLLGVANQDKPLAGVFNGVFNLAAVSDPTNFVGENIYQFTVTFHVQVTDSTKTPPVTSVPVTLGKDTKSFRILGTGILTDPVSSNLLLPSGRVTAMEVSVTVISDFGIDQLKRRTFTETQQAEFLAKNSYQYTKLVQLPSM